MTGAKDLPRSVAPATGSRTVDDEHNVQLGLLDAAVSAVDRQSFDQAWQLVEQLHEYTQAHFMSEQLLLRQSARPNYDGHLEDHERLMNELDQARQFLRKDDYSATLSALRSHHSHLIDHIRSWDRSIAEPPDK
ncbi:MAG: hemerythrin family protein [Xanthomonadales bacterium]|nr:hemerythrin family protein [Gammaproteobacteria bacterium]MBT8054871.1 hemerythrin family protein [Gammaproteobacteria bacterium]NNK51381.1 hemerythrin family protein [Xanthomonadales bacterium]